MAALFAIPSAQPNHTCNLSYIYKTVSMYKPIVIFDLLVSCVLPLCVIVFSYIMTARHLVKSAQPISEETQSPQLNTRRNTAKIVLGLTVVYLICYVPFHVLRTYLMFNISSGLDDYFVDEVMYTVVVSIYLLLLNSCLNPVALFCTSLAFRRQFNAT